MADADEQLLKALATVLRKRGLRWYLFGARAAIFYGRPRYTADVDVTVAVDVADVPALIEDLKRAKLAVRKEALGGLKLAAFVGRSRVIPLEHLPTARPLDLVLAGDAFEAEFLTRAKIRSIGKVRIPVISPEDLIVTKIIAGRAKDLDDVAGVLRAQRRLNLARIRTLLRRIEEIMGQSDLLPMFEQLAASAPSKKK